MTEFSTNFNTCIIIIIIIIIVIRRSFAFAERLIDAQAAAIGSPAPTTLYMVGDNPLTDIQGAVSAGGRWRAVLTQSGMFTGGVEENAALDSPAHILVSEVGEIVDILGLSQD